MWSYFLVLVRTLAAAFWTICSLFIKRAEHPPKKALQYSNLEVINTLIHISAFDIESIGLSLDIFKMKKCSFTNARNVAVKG